MSETNAQSKLRIALKALELNLLTDKDKRFIESIKDYQKEDLKNMRNYSWLADIARRNYDKVANATSADEAEQKEPSIVEQHAEEQLMLIDTAPEMRPHFQLVNIIDGKADEVETDWILLDHETAQVLMDFLRRKFPTLK